MTIRPLDQFVSSKKLLRTKCEPVKSRFEGGIIARKLVKSLRDHNKRADALGSHHGYFLSAPQIGIFQQVAIVAYPTLCVLMNPIIIEKASVKILRKERSLSFEGKLFETYRWPWVIVKSGVKPKGGSLDTFMFGPLHAEDWNHEGLTTSAVAQQAIAHLFGLFPADFQSEDYPDFEYWGGWFPGAKGPSLRAPSK